MAIGRNGMFFTISAVLLSIVLVSVFLAQYSTGYNPESESIRQQIAASEKVLESLHESYLPTVLRLSSYRALQTLAEYVRLRRFYFTDYGEFNRYFAEVMLNGTIHCGAPSVTYPINIPVGVEACICDLRVVRGEACPNENSIDFMRSANLSQRLLEFQNVTRLAMNLNITFQRSFDGFGGVNIYQDFTTGPFKAGVNMSFNYSVFSSLAWWNTTENISVQFDIWGLEDPLYSVGTSGWPTIYRNTIKPQNSSLWWNLSTLFLQTDFQRYRAESNASSYLQRFYGEFLDSKCCGIESLINPVIMTVPQVELESSYPYVDWCFLGRGSGKPSRCPTTDSLNPNPGNLQQLWNISCITRAPAAADRFDRFTLDTDHVASYNVTDYEYQGIVGSANDLPIATCQPLMKPLCAYQNRPIWLTCP